MGVEAVALGNLARGAIGFLFLAIQCGALADAGREAKVCAKSVAAASKSNTTQLWLGADICKLAGQLDDSAFLLAAGKIRAATDLNALKAASDQDKLETYDISKRLGASDEFMGEYEVYRDRDRKDRLMQRIGGYQPNLDGDYDPGWDFRGSATAGKYSQMLSCQKALRVQRLEDFIRLINNDEYYAARTEFDEVAALGSRNIKPGSPSARQLRSAVARVRAAAAKIKPAKGRPKECDFMQIYEPDPDAEFTQIFSGTNGPTTSGGSAFDSEAKVRDSWIAKALSPQELKSVLGQVDFDSQILVALVFGKRTNATGKVYITNVDHNAITSSFRVIGRFGANGEGCKEPRANSYPFALAVAPRPEKTPKKRGSSLTGFPDGCKPVVSSNTVSEKK